MSAHILSIAEIAGLAARALRNHGASDKSGGCAGGGNRCSRARRHSVARPDVSADLLRASRLAARSSGRRCRSCRGRRRQASSSTPHSGFAHAAIDLGLPALVAAAAANGVASLAIRNSYNCGVLGYHTERLAEAGVVALGFTNAPASIAPWGARKPALGTNPWSLAVPDGNGAARFVIDQSASVVAKSEVMKRARAGEPIPEGWAFDARDKPTTDPAAALTGTMAPAGGYKGRRRRADGRGFRRLPRRRQSRHRGEPVFRNRRRTAAAPASSSSPRAGRLVRRRLRGSPGDGRRGVRRRDRADACPAAGAARPGRTANATASTSARPRTRRC